MLIKTHSSTNKIVIVDGISGTGKTMIGPIVGSLKGVSSGKFDYNFEYIAILNYLGLIDSKSSSEVLKYTVENAIYYDSIGREVNFRMNDLSSVLKLGHAQKYLKKIITKSTSSLYSNAIATNDSFMLWTHQLIATYPILNLAFGSRLKLIECVRHPINLFDHWIHRNWWDVPFNPNLITQRHKSELYWYFKDDKYNYNLRSPEDKSIIHLINLYEKLFLYVDNPKILFIPFEKFVLNPWTYIRNVEAFIGCKKSFLTDIVMKKEKVPRENVNLGTLKAIYKKYGAESLRSKSGNFENYTNTYCRIKEKTASDVFSEFELIVAKYEQRFGRWF